MVRSRTAAVLVAAFVAVAAGCGQNSSGSTRADDQGGGANAPLGKPGPPGPSLRVLLEGQAAGTDAFRRGALTVRPGTTVELRARIRNAGRTQTGAVLAALRLPRGVTPDLDTLRERDVAAAEALGDPFTNPEDVFGAGAPLSPFEGGASTRIEVSVHIPGGASGDLPAAARVSAPGTAARSALTLRVG
jgi:hypothetical protein